MDSQKKNSVKKMGTAGYTERAARSRSRSNREKVPEPEVKANAVRTGRFNKTLGFTVRWGTVALLLWTLIGITQSGTLAREEAKEVSGEVDLLESKKEVLATEQANLSDEEYRLKRWKVEFMRHEPGERYLRFTDSE